MQMQMLSLSLMLTLMMLMLNLMLTLMHRAGIPAAALQLVPTSHEDRAWTTAAHREAAVARTQELLAR